LFSRPPINLSFWNSFLNDVGCAKKFRAPNDVKRGPWLLPLYRVRAVAQWRTNGHGPSISRVVTRFFNNRQG
jgi:hypothetical protein